MRARCDKHGGGVKIERAREGEGSGKNYFLHPRTVAKYAGKG